MNAKKEIAKRIVDTLRKAAHQAYFAGGCVRDQIRGVEPKDFDIATSADPETVRKLFAKTIPVGVQFGVIIVLEEEIPFEVATFRTEDKYVDGRRPSVVNFSSVEEDAKRRDFTVNGLYQDPTNDQVIDLVGGQKDIQKKLIRTIGDPDKRFLEDHLRMFRAIRFAVQLGFEIDPPTFASVQKNAALLAKVSQERIRDELSKTLTSANPARGIELLDQSGLLPFVMPEVLVMKGVEQPMEYHPEGDVFIHTLLLLKQLSHPPLELALGALLHDIAKPATFVRAPDRIRFHGHDKLGAEMTHKILKRLNYPNQTIDLVASLVNEHLRFKDAFQMRVSTLKRFLSLDRFDLHLALHKIDCMASHGKLEAHEFCTRKFEEFKLLPPPPSRIVSGHDLIEMGLSPGKEFTQILRAVEDAVLEGTVQNREEGLKFIRDNFFGKPK
jgi:putative nucleotidyltransferase with HDIG domain